MRRRLLFYAAYTAGEWMSGLLFLNNNFGILPSVSFDKQRTSALTVFSIARDDRRGSYMIYDHPSICVYV